MSLEGFKTVPMKESRHIINNSLEIINQMYWKESLSCFLRLIVTVKRGVIKQEGVNGVNPLATKGEKYY